MDGQDESEARQKVRELMSQPPAQRPADFVNPLEKIEQLLTCPICLDRYKQPKLLPCQHTFCYPCLENCADVLHRTLKCPECRAEHSVPYDGVKSFQSNYTLTGFLEIHLQSTPDSAQEIEDYIHRYNLERCKICDEKAECDLCAHCDRRACKECRSTHMDMLKRDMGRLLNQVRRLSNRIIEASDSVSKGIELLNMNCETTKDEVKEYYHRYQRDLKKREEAYVSEIETFQATESRLMSNLRDVLEIESSNMSEAVARLDAAIKGECSMEDSELVRLKNTFTEGLEYLRNFQPDADELFSRKLRFSAGEDAAKLPQAISTCGELCILVPQFAGRYLPLEQSYLPRPFRLPLESDHFRSRVDEREKANERTSSRLSHRERERERERDHNRDVLDESSIRYRRRQALEDEAWNRVRGTGTAGASTSTAEDRLVARSPWAKPPDASSLNAALDKKETRTPAKKETEAPKTKKEERKELPSLPTRPTPRESLTPVAPETLTPAPQTNGAAAKPPPSPVLIQDDKDQEQRFVRKPPLPRQASSNDDSLNEKVDSIRRAHAERQAASRTASRAPSSDESDGEEARPVRNRIRIVCREASMPREDADEPRDHREGLTPIPVTHFSGEEDSAPSVPAWLARRRQRFARSRTNPDLSQQFTSQRVQQLLQERTARLDSTTSEEDRRVRRRSASRDAGEWRSRGRPRAIFGRKGANEGELNWPRGVCAMPGGLLAICDSSNHRICIFDKEGKHVRSFGGYGSGPGQLDSAAGLAVVKQRLVVSDRYNHRVCLFGLDGQFVSAFGGHGQGNGRFNNPWGVAVDDLGTIFVCDKDNHRVQMFDKNGLFVGKFGSIGHGPGQLNSPLFVAVNKMNHQVYVSDSSNHRICVFDGQGTFLFSFGAEGFHGGSFKFPRGITVDKMGNILVADSGNNRIQVFTSDGEFISTFGSWGGGAGQLKGVEALCIFDGGIVASDRENHRIQVF